MTTGELEAARRLTYSGSDGEYVLGRHWLKKLIRYADARDKEIEELRSEIARLRSTYEPKADCAARIETPYGVIHLTAAGLQRLRAALPEGK